MTDNFPGQVPAGVLTTKYPVTVPTNQTQVIGPVQTTDVATAASLNYLLTQQTELLTALLIQMQIANFYLQSLTGIPDEPPAIANELLTERIN